MKRVAAINCSPLTVWNTATLVREVAKGAENKGDQLRNDLKSFERKSMKQITDKPDPRLELARLASSAVNNQPWYFAHESDTIHVHCSKKGSTLDAGIALAHLYVSNEDNFRFFKTDIITDLPGYTYIGSVTL